MNERHQPLPMPFGEFVALMAVKVHWRHFRLTLQQKAGELF